ncbi:MAG: hypothetical protein AAFQ51_14515, partial [Pseudomonadota bacterium]
DLIDPDGGNPARAFGFFAANLAKALAFHTTLGTSGFHSNTKMFYSNAGGAFRCWDKVDWRCVAGAVNTPADLAALPTGMTEDSGGGRFAFQGTAPGRVWGTRTVEVAAFEIQGANANGDATVHTGSGIHVPPTVESDASPGGYSHDQAFNDRGARNQVRDWLSEMVADMV